MLLGADLVLCLWEITYNKLSNIKQKDHCRFRENYFLLLRWQRKLGNLNTKQLQGNFLQHILIETDFNTTSNENMHNYLHLKRVTNNILVFPFVLL